MYIIQVCLNVERRQMTFATPNQAQYLSQFVGMYFV